MMFGHVMKTMYTKDTTLILIQMNTVVATFKASSP